MPGFTFIFKVRQIPGSKFLCFMYIFNLLLVEEKPIYTSPFTLPSFFPLLPPKAAQQAHCACLCVACELRLVLYF